MLDLLELEHRISDQRDEVERIIGDNATTVQLRSGVRTPRETGPRAKLRLRLALMLIRLGSRLVGEYSPPAPRIEILSAHLSERTRR